MSFVLYWINVSDTYVYKLVLKLHIYRSFYNLTFGIQLCVLHFFVLSPGSKLLLKPGMASTSCQRQVNFDHYTDLTDEMLVFSGTTGHINTNFRKEGSVITANENGNS